MGGGWRLGFRGRAATRNRHLKNERCKVSARRGGLFTMPPAVRDPFWSRPAGCPLLNGQAGLSYA
jgi:hypothetical protein